MGSLLCRQSHRLGEKPDGIRTSDKQESAMSFRRSCAARKGVSTFGGLEAGAEASRPMMNRGRD
jgi:hypothetical protein